LARFVTHFVTFGGYIDQTRDSLVTTRNASGLHMLPVKD
jgi:hypothetical protein